MIHSVHLLAVWHYTARMISERLLWHVHQPPSVTYLHSEWATVYILKVHQLRRYLVFDLPPRLPAPVHWSEPAALATTLASPFFKSPTPPPLSHRGIKRLPGRKRGCGQTQLQLVNKMTHLARNSGPSASVSGGDALPGSWSRHKSIQHRTRNERFSPRWTFCVIKGWEMPSRKNIDDSKFEISPSKCHCFFFCFFFQPDVFEQTEITKVRNRVL